MENNMAKEHMLPAMAKKNMVNGKMVSVLDGSEEENQNDKISKILN